MKIYLRTQVVFASGTLIKTYLEPWGMSISLLVPATDLGFSRGLCGLYDRDVDNDFHVAQGKTVKAASDGLAVLEFVQNWRYARAIMPTLTVLILCRSFRKMIRAMFG